MPSLTGAGPARVEGSECARHAAVIARRAHGLPSNGRPLPPTPGATTMITRKGQAAVRREHLFREPGRAADANNLRPVRHGSLLWVDPRGLTRRP